LRRTVQRWVGLGSSGIAPDASEQSEASPRVPVASGLKLMTVEVCMYGALSL